SRLLAGGSHDLLNEPDGLLLGALVRNQLDAGDERSGVREVHTQEALGVRDRGGERGDQDGGGVRADDRVRASGGTDARERRVLDLDLLGHGLFDEVRVGDGRLDGRGRRDVRSDALHRIRGKETVGDELGGLLEQSFVVLGGDLLGDVGDLDGEARQREYLGDAAAHVSGSDDGDCAIGHDVPYFAASGSSVRMYFSLVAQTLRLSPPYCSARMMPLKPASMAMRKTAR